MNLSEFEEPLEQKQEDGKENPSPGKEGAQGACGTTADENPGKLRRQGKLVDNSIVIT